jgi:SNF2 family DNA or RNA helicase
MNIKFSLFGSKIKVLSEDFQSNKWIMFRNEIKSICNSFDYDYQSNTISISVNDYLSLMSYQAEYEEEYGFRFVKNNEISRIESDNKIEEIDVTESELLSKLQKEGFKRTLTQHQLKNVLKMIKYNSSASFSVPGAGKTTEALAFYAFKKTNQTKIIVVCPKNAFSSWDNEIKSCFEEHESFFRIVFPSSQVKTLLSLSNFSILVNYEKIRNIRNEIESYVNRLGSENIIMILDESHKIKHGNDGITGRTLLSLNHLPKYKLILTGTPCPNSVEDLIGQFQFLFPNQIYDNSNIVEKTKNHYCRTTKAQLGLPKAKRFEDEIEMNVSQKALYNTIVSEMELQKKDFNLEDENKVRKIRRCIMWLIQITSNPKLLLKLEKTNIIPEGLLAGAESEKIKFACLEAERLASNGKKTLIWTNFTQNVQTLNLKLAHLGATYIDGSVKIANNEEDKHNNPDCREYRIDKFLHSDKCSVMIANPAAASESISLHKHCLDAIYVDRTYNAGQYLQSRDRIHRLGLSPTDNVSFIEPYHRGTVDEFIKIRLAEKIDIMEKILNDDSIQVSPRGWGEYYDDESEDFTEDTIPSDDLENIIDFIKPID